MATIFEGFEFLIDFQGSFESVSRKFYDCFLKVPRVRQECIGCVENLGLKKDWLKFFL